jgi:ribosomal protein S18 acetylase RimI-like enzyme
MAEGFLIRPFEPRDQIPVQNLIQEGLAEHFHSFDPALNPDLRDIETTYLQQGSLFLVVEIDKKLVGTGALIPESENIGRIVRVSVAKSHRRTGIGRLITENLIRAAPQFHYKQIVVETNDDWYDAIRLYQSCGFIEVDRRDGEVHMMLQP